MVYARTGRESLQSKSDCPTNRLPSPTRIRRAGKLVYRQLECPVLLMTSHNGRTDSSSVGRAMENKKTDLHFAVRGLRCDFAETSGAEPQAKGESVP